MNAADVLILCSDTEGSPVVIKEAMACNLPIVSTAVGDVPAVIQHVEGCYLAEQNTEDLADKLELALARDRRTDGRQAIQHLQTQGEARTILALYERVLARRCSGGAERNVSMRILVALGEGGHTKETLTLVDMLGDDLQFGYLIVQDDEVSERKIRRPGPVYYVLRPRDKQHRLLHDIAKTLQSATDSWRALHQFKPDACAELRALGGRARVCARSPLGTQGYFCGNRLTYYSSIPDGTYHVPCGEPLSCAVARAAKAISSGHLCGAIVLRVEA